MEEIQNGTFTTFFYDVSSFVTITFQYLEHPWAAKILLLILLGNTVLVLTKVSKQSRDLPQGWIVMSGRVCGIVWAST